MCVCVCERKASRSIRKEKWNQKRWPILSHQDAKAIIYPPSSAFFCRTCCTWIIITLPRERYCCCKRTTSMVIFVLVAQSMDAGTSICQWRWFLFLPLLLRPLPPSNLMSKSTVPSHKQLFLCTRMMPPPNCRIQLLPPIQTLTHHLRLYPLYNDCGQQI